MPFLDHDGNRLYYEDTGGNGTPVVFLHGFILDHTLWAPQVAALGGEYRSIALDGRGHGMSEANQDFTFTDSAGDVVALLDELGIDRAVLVGHSQGGWTVQHAALRNAERVAGLVLVSTTIHPFEPSAVHGFMQIRQGWVEYGPVGDLASAMAGIQFGATGHDPSVWAAKWQSRPPRAWAPAWSAIIDRLHEPDVSARFAQVKTPVAIVHGTADQAFIPDYAERARGVFPDVRSFTLVEGGPHSLPLTHPVEMTNALRVFLGELCAA